MSGEDKLNQLYSIKYDGLDFVQKANDAFAILPTDLKTNILLKDLPIAEVFTALGTMTNDNKNAQQVATTKALTFIPEKLKQAGSVIQISDTVMKNEAYQLNLNGNLSANTASTLGAIGNLDIEMSGLEALIKKLDGTSIGKAAIPQLAAFQLISNKEGDKNIAKIKLNKEGQIFVNDKDMSVIGSLLGNQ